MACALFVAPLRPQRDEVQAACAARPGEHLGALFLDVVIDVLAQHRHLRIEHRVGRVAPLDLGDQVLGAGMLDLGFVEQGLVLDPGAHGGVEDFFLDRGVDGQLLADLAGQLLLSGSGAFGFRGGEAFVFVEQGLDLSVVGIQQVAGVFFAGGAGRHVNFLRGEVSDRTRMVWMPAGAGL
jgi:hypothetical protein